MTKKRILSVLFLLLITMTAAVAQENVHRSPLQIYSGGVSVGALKSLNDELDLESSQFVKVSLNNLFYFRKQMSLSFDLDWFGPGPNFGADFGFNYFFSETDLRPFIGAGVGAHYFDREKVDFGESFGPSLKAQAGMLFELSETVQLKFQIPFHVVLNEFNDQGIGVEIGILFSGRHKSVQKLNYNRKANYQPKHSD